MLKFGDAVIKDNTDWLIYTPDRYVNIRYNTITPPSYVQASGVSSAKAGSTVTVTISEPQPLQELWNGYLIMYYYDKDHNYKTVNIHSKSFTVPTDVDALYNTIDIVPGYIASTEIDYEGIIRFDLAEVGKYIYISQCYPYVQSGTHYWWQTPTQYHNWESYNYNETAIAGMNANPPIYTSGGGNPNLNAIQSYETDDPSRMYTILNIGDKASTIGTGNFSFKYSTHLDVGIVTMRSYRKVNSLVTGITDVLVETKTFTPIKNETDVWPYSMYINI